ncbi:putative RNA methyltransferase [Dactylosporangium sp. NPDC000555]|uniref:putative RNA methyltransferase n=1 Tax=Dactylosporangium sp. NPDC000555 TaxID=3154260 RepID=UPI003331BA43
MHPVVITHLRCPVCRAPLSSAQRALRCAQGHSFDIARQGYADLTAGRPAHTGDTADMVAARAALLAAGHFEALTGAVADAVAREGAGLVIEVGAGTAHYLARSIRDTGSVGLAVDTSKAALKRAARAGERIGAVRADVWQGLPVADRSAAVVLDVFAPRSGAEFARVLRPGGALVVATPGAGHLGELVDALGLIRVDPAKRERLHKGLDEWFVPETERPVRAPLSLSRADAHSLVGMGPSAWHTDPAAIAAALGGMPEPIPATLDVDLTVWRPRP